MSRNVRHTLRALVLFLTAAMLCVCSFSVAWADSALTDEKREQLEIYGNGLTDTIILLSDEEMDSYENSADSFTLSSMEAWKTSKDELGAYLPDAQTGDVTVVEKSGKYTVTVPRVFENADVNFVYIFDRTLNPTAITIDVKLPMGVTLVRALLNTIIGICTVFLVLIFLSFVISLLGKVPALLEGKTLGKVSEGKKKGAEVSAPAVTRAAAAPAPAPVYEEDDLALVAVITAAIEAYTGMPSGDGTGDTFVVRSIRRSRPRR